MSERQQALDNNETRYNTGKPCKNGHFSDRYTQSGTCVDCVMRSANGHSSRSNAKELLIRQLKSHGFHLYPADFEALKYVAIAQIREKYPEITAEDISSRVVIRSHSPTRQFHILLILRERMQELTDMERLLNKLNPDHEQIARHKALNESGIQDAIEMENIKRAQQTRNFGPYMK